MQVMVLKRIGEAVGEVTAGFVFIHHQVGDVIAYSLDRALDHHPSSMRIKMRIRAYNGSVTTRMEGSSGSDVI